MTTVDINSMNGDYLKYRYDLEFIKESSRSIHCRSRLYGDLYRIEKATGKVYCEGEQIADTCQYEMF